MQILKKKANPVSKDYIFATFFKADNCNTLTEHMIIIYTLF